MKVYLEHELHLDDGDFPIIAVLNLIVTVIILAATGAVLYPCEVSQVIERFCTRS